MIDMTPLTVRRGYERLKRRLEVVVLAGVTIPLAVQTIG
jgi:hypothetical protein